MLWLAALGSLLLHLLLVLGWAQHPAGAPSMASGNRDSLVARLGAAQKPAAAVAAAEIPVAQALPRTPPQRAMPMPTAALQQASAAGGASSTVADRDYLPVEWLTRKPEFVGDIRHSLLAGLEDTDAGSVSLQLLISATGGVDRVLVESSSLGEEGTRRLVRGLMLQRLSPGEHDGVAVRARWRLAFDVEAVGAAP